MSNPKLNPLAQAVRRSLTFAALAAMSVSLPAVAQDDDEDSAELDRLEVTGSRIKRTDIEGPSPVLVVTREDLDATGFNTVQDYVRTLAITARNNTDLNTNSFANATSQINLRGLGGNTTLVLINGRRVAAYGQGQNIVEQFVDLNSIPLSAIERIEILKDGASAIYGADAVAGVVNVILRKDYQGAEVSAAFLDSTDGDAGETNVSAVFGSSSADTSITVSANYFERNSQLLRDRDFSSNPGDFPARGGVDQRSSFGNPGTVLTQDGQVFPDPACPPESISGAVCRFNFNDFINAFPKSTRGGITAFINHNVTDDINLYVDASFTSSRSVNIAAPAPFTIHGAGGSLPLLSPERVALSTIFGAPRALIIPVDNPGNFLGEEFALLYRPTDLGPRTGEIQSDNYRIVAGLQGAFLDAWDYDVGAGFTRNKVLVENRNSVDAARLQGCIFGCDPNGDGITDYYNPLGDEPDFVRDFVKVIYENRNISTEKYGYGGVSGFLPWGLPAGEIGLAAGVEYREQDLRAEADPLRNQGGLVGTGAASDTFGERDVTSAYVEFGLPLHDTVELQLAARYEDYSDFGTTTNPKVAIRWQPTSEYLFRASWGESFRAPSLFELFNGSVTSFNGVIDPIRCPDGPNGANFSFTTTLDCGGGQFRTENGGNPFLLPEESDSYNIGFVWAPDFAEGLELQADYWSFEHENIIAQPALADILAFDNPDLVNRSPATAAELAECGSERCGGIAFINNSFLNGDVQDASGLDLTVRYTWDTNAGTFFVNNDLTYYEKFEFTFAPSANDPNPEPIDIVGGTAILGGQPEFINNFQVGWNRGAHTVTAFIRHRDEVESTTVDTRDGSTFVIDSHTTLDVQWEWYVFPESRLAFGCQNCTDEDPPFDNRSFVNEGFLTNWDDPRGAILYGRFTQSF